MTRLLIYLITLLSILPLISCKNIRKNTLEIDNKSYITNFELIQKNSTNDTLINISSPKATIDSINNNIEIFDNSIIIFNGNRLDFKIKSGNALLNNNRNLIKLFNNVNISLLDTKGYFVKTQAFNFNLNNSIIELYRPLYIDFDNIKVSSLGGSYNINSGMLNINNNIFNRIILNSEGKIQYQIEIISDNAMWLKNENRFEFSSNNKQVEAKISFLTIK